MSNMCVRSFGKKSLGTILFLLGIFIALSSNWASAPEVVKQNVQQPNEVIPPGETLIYEVRWDPPAWMFFLPTISAGEMTLRFQEPIQYQGRRAYKITVDAVSSGFLPKLTGITVKDYFESIVDAEDFCSNKLTKITREGKRHRDIVLTFDRKTRKGRYLAHDPSKDPPEELKNETIEDLPPCVQDILSAIYHTRLRNLRVGEKYPLTMSDNGVVKEVIVKALKQETVKAVAGEYSTIKIETVSVFGGLFKDGGSFYVWVSDDERKIPIKYEAKVKLGKIFGTIKQIERPESQDSLRSAASR